MAQTRRKSAAHRPRATDRIDLPGFQDPQQLGLEVQRQFGDLVQEQRPAVGGPDPADGGPGRRR